MRAKWAKEGKGGSWTGTWATKIRKGAKTREIVSCPLFQGKGGLRDHFPGLLARNVKLWGLFHAFGPF